MRGNLVGTICILVLATTLAQAQGLQVHRGNRTISVSVTESVKADPEVARVHLGHSNYGAT